MSGIYYNVCEARLPNHLAVSIKRVDNEIPYSEYTYKVDIINAVTHQVIRRLPVNLPSKEYGRTDILNNYLLKRYIIDLGYRHVMVVDTERPDFFCYEWRND